MLKFFKALIMIIAVGILVSMGTVFASYDSMNSIVNEEKWHFQVGSLNVRYGTKYTILVNEEKYEFYLNYKEVIPESKSPQEAKFKGYYWRMKDTKEDLEKDDNYIYSDDIEITRYDVIEFLKIKDEKLAAIIKDGYEFSLYVEPFFNYQKVKHGKVYTNTVRELYAMLPEADGKTIPYEKARDEDGKVIKNKVQGIEFFRSTIVKAMNSIEAENLKEFDGFKNEYKNVIKDKMLNKGWNAYYFEGFIKTGEFIKLVAQAMYPDYEYQSPLPDEKDGTHWAKPYVILLHNKLLQADEYNDEIMEEIITREEISKIACKLFFLKSDEDDVTLDRERK